MQVSGCACVHVCVCVCVCACVSLYLLVCLFVCVWCKCVTVCDIMTKFLLLSVVAIELVGRKIHARTHRCIHMYIYTQNVCLLSR